MARRLVVIALIFLVAAGCAPTLVEIQKSELLKLKDAPAIHAVHYSPPTFTIMTPGKVAVMAGFGLIGGLIAGAAAESEGQQLMKEYALEDPSLRVRERLLAALSTELELKNVRTGQAPLESDGLDALQAKFGKDMVLDFRTDNWLLNHHPGNWSRYYVLYAVRSRLIRPEDSKVLWLGYCKLEPEDPSASPTLDELKANVGALLKEKLGQAADTCAQQLLAQLLGRTSAAK